VRRGEIEAGAGDDGGWGATKEQARVGKGWTPTSFVLKLYLLHNKPIDYC
jgi:hypothetical protein